MKQYVKPLALCIIGSVLFWSTATVVIELIYKPHVCYDKTHKTCDGHCECDGLECRGE